MKLVFYFTEEYINKWTKY